MKRIVLSVIVIMAMLGWQPTTAGSAPSVKYVVDETTLPFEPIAGFEDSQRLWGVHNNAGYRIDARLPAAHAQGD